MRRALAVVIAAVSLAGMLAVASPAEAAGTWPGRGIRPYNPPAPSQWLFPGERRRPVWTWLPRLPRPCPSGKVC